MSTAPLTRRQTRPPRLSPHPLQAILLAFPVALLPCALLSDVTYLRTAQIQWTNFSAWLITGALIPGGFALLWALVAAWTGRNRAPALRRRNGWHAVLLALAWVIALINAFQHSHDGWASVGTTGLVLSILAAVLALAAGWVAHSPLRSAGMENVR